MTIHQALGNLYFIHSSLDDCLIWDFHEKNFVSAVGQDIYTGSIEDVPLKEKSKFPQDFFPEVYMNQLMTPDAKDEIDW